MKIAHVSDSEINVYVEGKGYFNIMISDFGGDYPGVDVEYVSENESKATASHPRVLFEFPTEENAPSVKVWENPDSEDYTYSHTFDMEVYEKQEEDLDK